ncbi:MAG: energy transducer TonB [Agriterribacter sp.]
MRLLVFTLAFVYSQQMLCSQSDSVKKDETIFYDGCIEIPPKYPGGQKAMFKFILINVKYPTQAQRENIEGEVIVQYAIDTLGKTVDVQVYKGVNNDLDQEAIRLISLLKGWRPATQNGKKIKWMLSQPFVFVSDKSKKKIKKIN